MNFFFLGVVKAYEINHHTINELKDYISDAFTEIDGDRNLYRTRVRVLDRYEDWCMVEGGYFCHLRE